MNLLKVAFYQGANQALVDLGINKLAAKAAPITDNPYEDAPGANVKKVLGTSLGEIDDMFARIDSMSKSKQPAVAANKPAPRRSPVRQTATVAKGTPTTTYNFSDPDVITAKKPAAGAVRQTSTVAKGKPLTTYDFSEGDVITAKKPAPRVVAGKPRVTPEIPGGGVTFMSREDLRRKNAPKERPETVFTMDDYNLGEGPNPYAGKKNSGQNVGRLRSQNDFRYTTDRLSEEEARGYLDHSKKNPKGFPATSALSLEDARDYSKWRAASDQDVLIRKSSRGAADKKRLADYRNLQKTKGQDAADDFFEETQNARIDRDAARAKARAKNPNNT